MDRRRKELNKRSIQKHITVLIGTCVCTSRHNLCHNYIQYHLGPQICIALKSAPIYMYSSPPLIRTPHLLLPNKFALVREVSFG